MPGLINSAPDCVTSVDGAKPADDSADFIIQAPYEDCAGFMTFGPGSTYGDEGAAADTAHYILTVLGMVVTILALVAWILYENRRLVAYALAARRGAGHLEGAQPGPLGGSDPPGPAEGAPPTRP
jgi:hypothetical protein